MVEISVLDSKLERVAVLDKYVSFIWTDRYNESGEFELVIPISEKGAKYVKENCFLSIPTSDRMMIVESIKTETDSKDGNTYDITGRSLESILDRRIVWKQTNVNGSVQNALQKIINEAIINPVDSRRRIDGFVFNVSSDPHVTAVTYNKAAQYMGDSIYDVVKKVCQAYHLGFKMEWKTDHLEFGLYAGVDRSYDQSDNSYVVFSPTHDNLLSSKYLMSLKKYKNVLRIAGQGEGATQTVITYYLEFDDDKASEKTGLDRREIYVDCSDVSSITDGNTVMDVDQYTNTLVQKGVEKMVELVPETAFEGEIDTTIMFKYHTDFEVGDICEIRDEYGNDDQVRISEVVQTWEASGYSCVPTLESLSNEEGDTSSGSSETKTIKETVETTSVSYDTSGLKVCWTDVYGSKENAAITYLSHSSVKMSTQLMSIKYEGYIDTIGRYGAGNIDLYNRPKYIQPDGSISTVNSVSFGEDELEILIPTIAYKNGVPAQLTYEEAIDLYYESGQYLGKFKTITECNVYAEKLHEQQEWLYTDVREDEYWKITILKDGTSVTNLVDGTTEVYDRMRTIEWNYKEFVNFEVTHSS